MARPGTVSESLGPTAKGPSHVDERAEARLVRVPVCEDEDQLDAGVPALEAGELDVLVADQERLLESNDEERAVTRPDPHRTSIERPGVLKRSAA